MDSRLTPVSRDECHLVVSRQLSELGPLVEAVVPDVATGLEISERSVDAAER